VRSFEYDIVSSKYQHHWETWTEFQDWRAREEQNKCIELRLINTYPGLPSYERQCRYVCSRAGGDKPYTKIHPEWNRKREPKRIDCKCVLIVKEYPGVPTILGNYAQEHNHALGNANLPFMQISKDTREYIAGLLRLK
ncbi:hypothetical protein DFH09DRAFT_865509, partial [Mycena vulgaris]